MSKALTYRIKPYLNRRIHPSQTWFMHGRNIAFNIRKAINIINFADEQNLEAITTSLDFEKTFDRVEHTAIVGALKYFNFGEKLIKWIMLLYKEFESCTINAGYTSKLFKPTRGLHQGACESPIIFLLIVEIFGQNIRDNENIVGIKISETVMIKSGQFADDMVLFSHFVKCPYKKLFALFLYPPS